MAVYRLCQLFKDGLENQACLDSQQSDDLPSSAGCCPVLGGCVR